MMLTALLMCLTISSFPFSQIGQNGAATKNPNRHVAVTFDDLPATQLSSPATIKYVITKLLETIQTHKIPAIGFVNEGKLYVSGEANPERIFLLRMWLAAGLELGNHTFSHVAIDRVPLDVYQDEVIRGEIVPSKLLAERGQKLKYFRHTQLRTGPLWITKRASTNSSLKAVTLSHPSQLTIMSTSSPMSMPARSEAATRLP